MSISLDGGEWGAATTSAWSDWRGLHIKKSLSYLRRRCRGYNVLEDELSMMGPLDMLERIPELATAADGVYEVVAYNFHRDWETGIIEDYDLKLVPWES